MFHLPGSKKNVSLNSSKKKNGDDQRLRKLTRKENRGGLVNEYRNEVRKLSSSALHQNGEVIELLCVSE